MPVPVSLIVLGLLMFFFTGCVVVPILTNDDRTLGGRGLTTNQIHNVTIGVSTTNEVTEIFGTPDAIWEEEQTYVYWWVSRKAEVYWILVSTSGFAGGNFDVGRYNVLFAKFDKAGKLLEVAKTVRGGAESIGHHLLEWRDKAPTNRIPRVTQTAKSQEPKALVLFQLRATANGAPVEEATKNFWGKHYVLSMRNLTAGLGSFHTGGIPLPVSPRRLETAGWYSLMLSPGRYYLGLQPGLMLGGNPYSSGIDRGLLLRLEVPAHATVIYAVWVLLTSKIG